MELKDQLHGWANGKSIHDGENGRCCPDFSCCRPALLANGSDRADYYQAFLNKDKKTEIGLRAKFLRKALDSIGFGFMWEFVQPGSSLAELLADIAGTAKVLKEIIGNDGESEVVSNLELIERINISDLSSESFFALLRQATIESEAIIKFSKMLSKVGSRKQSELIEYWAEIDQTDAVKAVVRARIIGVVPDELNKLMDHMRIVRARKGF